MVGWGASCRSELGRACSESNSGSILLLDLRARAGRREDLDGEVRGDVPESGVVALGRDPVQRDEGEVRLAHDAAAHDKIRAREAAIAGWVNTRLWDLVRLPCRPASAPAFPYASAFAFAWRATGAPSIQPSFNSMIRSP